MPAQARRHRILAHPSRAALVPPTGFDWDAASRWAVDVPATLQLEHVHGYESVRNSAPNLFFTSTGHIVHYAAALGIVTDLSCIPSFEKGPHAPTTDNSVVPVLSSTSVSISMPTSQACDSHVDRDRRRSEDQDIRDCSHVAFGVAAEMEEASDHGVGCIVDNSDQDQYSVAVSASELSAASMTAGVKDSSAHSGVSISVCNALDQCVADAAGSDLSAGDATVHRESSEYSRVSVAVANAIDQCVVHAAAEELSAPTTPESVSGCSGTSAAVDRLVQELTAAASYEVVAYGVHTERAESHDTADVQVSDTHSVHAEGAQSCTSKPKHSGTEFEDQSGARAQLLDVVTSITPHVGGTPPQAHSVSEQVSQNPDPGLAAQPRPAENGPYSIETSPLPYTDAVRFPAEPCQAHEGDAGECAYSGEPRADGRRYEEACSLRSQEEEPQLAQSCAEPSKRQWQDATCSQAFFTGHDDDVLCLSMHPNRNIAATGQVRFNSSYFYCSIYLCSCIHSC